MRNLIYLPRAELRGILNFAGKRDPRAYLNGVRVEAEHDRVRLVATNGYVLGAWESEHGYSLPGDTNHLAAPSFTGVLPRAVVAALDRKGTALVALLQEPDGKRWRLADGEAFQMIPGGFAPYRLALRPLLEASTAPGPRVAQFNPEDLSCFARFAREVGVAPSLVRLLPRGPEHGALVSVGYGRRFVGAVQPTRSDPASPAEHQWVLDDWTCIAAAPAQPSLLEAAA